MGGLGGSADVVSLAARAGYRPGYKRLACAQVLAAREALGMSRPEFAAYLGTLLGWKVTPEAAGRWEDGSAPPGDVLLACAAVAGGDPLGGLSLLEPVPPSFPADALAGPWVTCYQFSGADGSHFHADIAHVTAESDRQVRAVNHPPEPRTEGRALPFRNEIRARLAGRHLLGEWKNVSDSRYFGALQLAVLPGETVMEGLYTGLASDVGVSSAKWKWIRLDAGDDDAREIALREPADLYALMMNRPQYDAPLTLAEVREEA